MARHQVTQRYESWRDGTRFGPWRAGDEVELADPDAEWVDRDTPGTLTAVDATGETVPPPSREKPPTRDRAHRGGSNREAR